MLPASFIIGEGLGRLSSWINSFPNFGKLKECLIPLILLILILSGNLPGLMPKLISPYQRTRQEDVFASMEFLQKGNCSIVASSGLWPDYLYLSAFTSLKYTGEIANFSEMASEKVTGVNCVAVAADSPYLDSFLANSTYPELYHNGFVWIFRVSSSSPDKPQVASFSGISHYGSSTKAPLEA
jgi:hypothetical protein